MAKTATNTEKPISREMSEPAPAPEKVAGRQSAAPICKVHGVPMRAGTTQTGDFTRYYCTVEGCRESVKQVIPKLPTTKTASFPVCPYHDVTCVQIKGSSSAYFTRFACPEQDCDFSVKQQRPNVKIVEEEDFAAR